MAEEDRDGAPSREDSILRTRAASGASGVGGPRGRRVVPGGERPTHPALAATLLMVGVVVLLALIAVQPLLGR